MTGGSTGERRGLFQHNRMNGPQGRRGRGSEKMNMSVRDGEKSREGRIKGGRERKTRKGDYGRRKENGRQGGQTGNVKGSLCLRHA